MCTALVVHSQYRATTTLNRCARQEKAEPGATGTGTDKHIEDPLALLLLNARSTIHDIQVCVMAITADLHADLTTCSGKMLRVDQHIGHRAT